MPFRKLQKRPMTKSKIKEIKNDELEKGGGWKEGGRRDAIQDNSPQSHHNGPNK